MSRWLAPAAAAAAAAPLMPFSTKVYGALWRETLRDAREVRQLVTHATLLTGLPAVVLAHELFLQLDRLALARRAPQHARGPLFIVGNARSGTTLLHRLLGADTDHFVCFKLWEIFLPSFTQKWLVDRAAHLDRRLGGPLHGLFGRLEQRLFGGTAHLHRTGFGAPEEDEFLLLPTLISPVVALLFPFAAPVAALDQFDQLPSTTRGRVMEFYRAAVHRQLELRGPGRTLLSKNAAFISKLRSVAETFPDGRFIYLVRDPAETIPSLLDSLGTAWSQLGLSRRRAAEAQALFAQTLVRNYRYAFETLEQLDPQRYLVVRYTDLVQDPLATVQRIYESFDLQATADFWGQTKASSTRARRHRSGHRYRLEDYGLSRTGLRAALPEVYRVLDSPVRAGAEG